jgi:hypothetical protein
MKGLSIILLGFIFLIACGQRHEGEMKTGLLSHLVSITDNEDKGVKEILNFYGGECKYSIGTTASTDEGKKKYFELEMSKSDMLENYAKLIEMPSSNIAFMFYYNLKEEKRNYTQIKVVVKLKDGHGDNFEYSTSQLEIVKQKVDLIFKVSDLIKLKDYNGLYKLFDLTVAPNLKETDIESYCSKSDIAYGQIVKFQLQGFSFFNSNGKDLLHLAGVQQRDKQNTPLTIFVDPKKTQIEGSVITMKFEF